jgi:preprotein translocase subunit SecE
VPVLSNLELGIDFGYPNNPGFCIEHQQSNMNKVSNYFRESYRELLEKVSWPTWTQLQQSTVIVLVATILITAIVWTMDLLAQAGLKFIYSLFA